MGVMADLIRVLYVDDEPSLLTIAKLFLEKEGDFAVDVLTSAREAIDRLASEEYDAIVSDYQMPEMNGIALSKTLKLNYPGVKSRSSYSRGGAGKRS